MATESNERKVIIAILMTSTVLTMLGIAGLLGGAYDLSLAPLQDPELTGIDAQIFEARVTNPYRRPMAAANVVVSALVLVGSFLLSWRRKLAQWWIRQAVVAKLIWIAANTIALVSHIKMTFAPLPVDAGETLPQLMTGVVVVGSFSAALHLLAAYRATRPDIGAFIESTPRS
jgi:hypothetical protein